MTWLNARTSLQIDGITYSYASNFPIHHLTMVYKLCGL